MSGEFAMGLARDGRSGGAIDKIAKGHGSSACNGRIPRLHVPNHNLYPWKLSNVS